LRTRSSTRPTAKPTRHFRFGDEGITNEIIENRRASAYIVPIPLPKKQGKQLQFDTEWTQDRIELNDQVNRVRERVKHWREGRCHVAGSRNPNCNGRAA
jgi:type III restriction enzyme